MSKRRKQNLIDNETARIPSVNQEQPMDISNDALQSESELEKIAPVVDDKALKTQSPSKKLTFALLFIAVNLVAILGTAVMEFAGNDAPVHISSVWNTFMDNWYWGVGAIAMFVIGYLAQGAKRYVLLKSTLKKHLPLIGLNATILCKYYDNITPLSTGGQPFEIYYLRKKGIPVGIASGVPIVSYAIDRIAYVIVALVTICIYGFGSTSTVIIVLCVIGLSINAFIPVAIFVFTVMPNVGEAITSFVVKIATTLHLTKNPDKLKHKLTDSIIEYAECIKYFLKKSKKRMFIGFLLSCVFFLSLYSIAFFTVRMSGNSSVGWGEMFALCVICYTSVTMLPTPGNSGGAELSFRSIFAKYLSGGLLFWGMLAWRIISYYFTIVIGIILIIIQQIGTIRKFNKLAKAEQSSSAKTQNQTAENKANINSNAVTEAKTSDGSAAKESEVINNADNNLATDNLSINKTNAVVAGKTIPLENNSEDSLEGASLIMQFEAIIDENKPLVVEKTVDCADKNEQNSSNSVDDKNKE